MLKLEYMQKLLERLEPLQEQELEELMLNSILKAQMPQLVLKSV